MAVGLTRYDMVADSRHGSLASRAASTNIRTGSAEEDPMSSDDFMDLLQLLLRPVNVIIMSFLKDLVQVRL